MVNYYIVIIKYLTKNGVTEFKIPVYFLVFYYSIYEFFVLCFFDIIGLVVFNLILILDSAINFLSKNKKINNNKMVKK